MFNEFTQQRMFKQLLFLVALIALVNGQQICYETPFNVTNNPGYGSLLYLISPNNNSTTFGGWITLTNTAPQSVTYGEPEYVYFSTKVSNTCSGITTSNRFAVYPCTSQPKYYVQSVNFTPASPSIPVWFIACDPISSVPCVLSGYAYVCPDVVLANTGCRAPTTTGLRIESNPCNPTDTLVVESVDISEVTYVKN